MDPILHAFFSPHFDAVYSRFATARWANTARQLDVPTIHAGVRAGIAAVVRAARQDLDPGARVFVARGESGLGKTHCLAAELWRHSSAGDAYPVLMQLAVAVDPSELSRWVIKKVMDGLAANAFTDAAGHTPLQRLADRLWSHARPGSRRTFASRVEDGDDEAVDRLAVTAGRHIRRALAPAVSSSDDVVIAGILARAEDFGDGFKAWVNGSTTPKDFGGRPLDPLLREDERRDVLISLARVCRATGSPLVVAVDQIEATETVASADLLRSLLTYAVQLVDDGIQGTAVIISALSDTMGKVTLPASLAQRIELAPAPVQMRTLEPTEVRAVLRRRAELLMGRAGVTVDGAAADAFSPDWLLDGESPHPRDVLDAVRRYRERCLAAERLLTREEYRAGTGPGPPPPPPPRDFDKLWEDHRDRAVGGVQSFSDQQRLDLLAWYLQQSAAEIPGLASVAVTEDEFRGDEPTRLLTLDFKTADGATFEAWTIGYCDAPVHRGRLNAQILAVLDHCADAKPAVCRPGTLTGVDGTRPDRPPSALKRLKTGPSLVALLESGGRLAPAEPRHWDALATARAFAGQFADAAGFLEWRQERRFLTNEVNVGPLAALAQPEGDPTLIDAPDRGGATSPRPERPSPPPPDGSADPRDQARILIGSHDGDQVFWNLDRAADPSLPNFGVTVSGDAGQGKTQIIKGILAEAAALACPILVFDFKNDYTGEFAAAHGFEVVELRNGLPFNPLRPPPHGSSGVQIISHVYEVSSVLSATLGLGVQQTALLRSSLSDAFEARGQPLREWVDVDGVTAPALAEVVAVAAQRDHGAADSLINRLGLLHGMRLLPGDDGAALTFADLMAGRYVLSFKDLPNDDALKAALAEMVLIQLQGYMLRGDQPRALRRALVFDEAWRASQSDRLIQLAREGRAFGVAVVVGTQFPDDLSPDLVGNLATKLYLYNSDALRRRKVVKALVGTTSGTAARALEDALGRLNPFEGVFANQQHSPYRTVELLPYFKRRHREPAGSG